jgi:hypothetical protein
MASGCEEEYKRDEIGIKGSTTPNNKKNIINK